MASLPLKYGQSFFIKERPGDEFSFLDLNFEVPNESIKKGSEVILYNKTKGNRDGKYFLGGEFSKELLVKIFPLFSGVTIARRYGNFPSGQIQISIIEDPSNVSSEAPTVQVALQNTLNQGYLTVCQYCNNLPGFSVDTHASSPSGAEGSIWMMTTLPSGQVTLTNTLTGTLLSVCDGCNNLSGYSVDVHESSVSASSTWNITFLTPNATNGPITLQSQASESFLEVCFGCIKSPNGYSVDVGTTSVQKYSTWNLQILTPPSPSPSPPGPGPLTPLVPSTASSSTKTWLIWFGVGLWLSGLMLWLAIPKKLIAVRIIGSMISLSGIGLIFYSVWK